MVNKRYADSITMDPSAPSTVSHPSSSSAPPAPSAPTSPTATAASASPTASAGASAIRSRAFSVNLSEVPRHWMGDHPVPTHIVNGLNLLFPIGERFFVRSVKAYLDTLDDPALIAEVRAFFGQEGKHASAHDRVNQMLRDQGFEVDRFLAGYRRAVEFLEHRMSPAMCLSVTAATEHFTAIMAESAFSSPLLERAAPPMKALLAWHALEEIEHRSVAFDVLAKVRPSYALRIAGLAVATTTLAGFWAWATLSLLRQDPALGASSRFARPPREQRIIRRVFSRGIRDYLRPGFHPQQRELEALAGAWIRRHLPAMEAALLVGADAPAAAPPAPVPAS